MLSDLSKELRPSILHNQVYYTPEGDIGEKYAKQWIKACVSVGIVFFLSCHGEDAIDDCPRIRGDIGVRAILDKFTGVI